MMEQKWETILLNNIDPNKNILENQINKYFIDVSSKKYCIDMSDKKN